MWQDFPWLVVVVADLGLNPVNVICPWDIIILGCHLVSQKCKSHRSPFFLMINYLVGGIPTPL